MATAGEIGQDRQSDRSGNDWPRSIVCLAALCLAVGLLWRTVRYLLQFPIWGDEAMVLINVVDRDYLGLTGSLWAAQVAPILFLWGEKLAVTLLGTSELAVRLLSYLAGSAGLVILAGMARRWMTPVHGTLAIGVLAVSYFPVRHACEAKPYALDLLMAVVLMLGTVGWICDPRRSGWLIFLTLAEPIAILSSYPAAFVAGAMSLAMLPKLWRAPWSVRGIYVLCNLLMLGAFVGHYLGVARSQQAKAGAPDFLQTYWQEAFPPDAPAEVPLWLLKIHAGMLLAYPVGGSEWASSGSMVLGALGAWYLWTRGRRSLLLVCVLPFGVTLAAAVLHKYPYGGSARVAQHLAPMACVLIAAGGAWLLERFRTPTAQQRWAWAVCLALGAVGIGGAVRDIRRPYKAEYEQHVRALIENFWTRTEPGDCVVLGTPAGLLPVIPEWYLRHDRPDVVWIGSPSVPDLSGRTVWLWMVTLDVPPESAAMATLGDRGRGLAMVGCERFRLPPSSGGEPNFIATVFRLVPDGR